MPNKARRDAHNSCYAKRNMKTKYVLTYTIYVDEEEMTKDECEFFLSHTGNEIANYFLIDNPLLPFEMKGELQSYVTKSRELS